ncbi:Glycosyltransferase EpsD [Sulfitobacter noctilucae]|nr:Glycosyltransferase EpsD [Sulfitobacter noctilucae]
MVGGDGRPSGVPRHILHLAGALKDHVRLSVVSDKDLGGYTALHGMHVPHIVVRGLTNRMSPLHLWRGITGLLKVFRETDPDLIWIHSRLQVLLFRLLLALNIWRPTCAVAFTHHGLPYGRGYNPVVHRICKELERALVATCPAHNLVFLNHRMAGWMARDARASRLARHRVHILANCSDLRPLPSRRKWGIRTLVMTGRTGRQKDYETAAQLLAEMPENYRLILCGPGTDDPVFQSRISGVVPPETFRRITFTGPLPDVRIPLAQADAYLLTSRYEGTPIGALEAFEAGLPIILRNFDGATDLTAKHPCSLLVELKDLRREALRISEMLDHFDRYQHGISSDIVQVWQDNWSPDIFAHNALALVRSMLQPASVPQARPDFVRGALTLHPDHHKSADVLVPTQQPYHTDVSPSAGNG